MDQSNRYADLSLKEEDLIKGGKHLLVAYNARSCSGAADTQVVHCFTAKKLSQTRPQHFTTIGIA